jgi:hypothetical protein
MTVNDKTKRLPPHLSGKIGLFQGIDQDGRKRGHCYNCNVHRWISREGICKECNKSAYKAGKGV